MQSSEPSTLRPGGELETADNRPLSSGRRPNVPARLNWVKRVVLTLDRTLPVYLNKQTFPVSVRISQNCQANMNLSGGTGVEDPV